MVLGLFETGYHALLTNLFKNLYQYFFKKLMVTRGNPLQIVPKLCQTEKKSTVTRVVTR